MSRKSLNAVLLTLAAAGTGLPSGFVASRDLARRMKFGQPLLTTELSGSAGGITGSSARGGVNYFRVRRVPGNPRSTQQSRIRAILSSVASAWRSTLTDAQRLAWTAFATSGESGIDVYADANVPLVQGTGARVSAAPASRAAVFTPPTLANPETANPPDATGVAATDPWNATAGGVLNVYISTNKQSSSRLSQQFPFRWGSSFLRAGAALDNAGLTTLVDTAMANVGIDSALLVPGDVFYVKLLARAVDGRKSDPVVYRLITVAP